MCSLSHLDKIFDEDFIIWCWKYDGFLDAVFDRYSIKALIR